jgi:hypothetical protein
MSGALSGLQAARFKWNEREYRTSNMRMKAGRRGKRREDGGERNNKNVIRK